MSNAFAPSHTLLGEITDFLASNPSPEAIVAYQLPEDLVQRAHDLAERNAEDELSEAERQEMLDFARLDQMLSLLKIKTRIKLQKAAE